MIDPGRALPLTEEGFCAACDELNAIPAALWAVVDVETSGCGFIRDRRPAILFERHVFNRLTGGRFFSIRADVSNPVPGGYGASGAHQYERLDLAAGLDHEAALKSASWGLGQIMGFNFSFAGYHDVQSMISAFADSEDNQLSAMAHFIKVRRYDGAIATKNWREFARCHNGQDFAINAYDERLAVAFKRRLRMPPMNFAIRAHQMELFFQDRYHGALDGIPGPLYIAADEQLCL